MRITGKFSFRVTTPDGETWQFHATNSTTDEGLRALLDKWHDAAVPESAYLGWINTGGGSAYAKADTLALHPGWTEFPTFRQLLLQVSNIIAPDNLSTVAINTASKILSPVSASAIRGVLVSNVNLGSSGFLFSTADFDEGPQVIPRGAKIDTTYTITLAG